MSLDLVPHRTQRAISRIGEVHDAWLEYHDRYIDVRQIGRDGRHEVIFEVAAEPPVEIALGLSEVISHLRAALDNIAWALAEVNCLSGNTPDKQTAWVICDTEYDDDSLAQSGLYSLQRARSRQLRSLSLSAQDMVASFQPYQGNGWEKLQLLKRLSNWDKHRALNVTAVGATLTAASTVYDPRHTGFFEDAFLTPGPALLVNGSVVASIATLAIEKADLQIITYPGFGYPAKNEPALDILHDLSQLIEDSILPAANRELEPMKTWSPKRRDHIT